jgi:hypothetical protein
MSADPNSALRAALDLLAAGRATSVIDALGRATDDPGVRVEAYRRCVDILLASNADPLDACRAALDAPRPHTQASPKSAVRLPLGLPLGGAWRRRTPRRVD